MLPVRSANGGRRVLEVWRMTASRHMSTTTSSTTISFAWVRWWKGEDGGAPSARASVYSRRKVVQ
jgi:hypothetical protein